MDRSTQSTMAPFAKDEPPNLSSAPDTCFGGISGPAEVSLNGSTIFSSIPFKGTRNIEWNKAVSLQQLLSLRNVQDDKSIEKGGQNLSDRLVSHLLHPSLIQDIAKHGQGNGLCSQGFNLDHIAFGDHGDKGGMQIRSSQNYGNQEAESYFVPLASWCKNPLMGITAQALEEHKPSANLSPDSAGTMLETMLSLSVSNSKEKVLSAPVLRAQPEIGNGASSLLMPVGRCPFPGSFLTAPVFGGVPAGSQTRVPSSDVSGKQSSPQLTIFYDGNVNVYDDISKDKAHEIMFLAASGSSWPTKVLNSPLGQCASFGLSNAATSQSRPGSPQAGYKISGNRPEKLKLNVQTGQSVINNQPVTGQAGQIPPPANKQPECAMANTPLVASSALPSGQPVVPRALPQARKASLARFLEKRKERVKSKSPYLMKNPPEELLPGERFSSSNYDAISPTSPDGCVDKKSMPMPCGVEEVAGTCEATSTCDMDGIEEFS